MSKIEEAFKRRKMAVWQGMSWILRDESKDKEINLMRLEHFLHIKDVPFLKNEVLSEIVSELGDTPQKEAELYKLIKDKDEEGVLKFIGAKEGNENLTLDYFDEMPSQEYGNFIDAIVYRVTNHRDANGELKVVEQLKEAKVPTRKTARDIKALQKELAELTDIEEITAKAKEIDELLLNASFDKKKAKEIAKDEWLKELLVLTQETYINETKTPLGGF